MTVVKDNPRPSSQHRGSVSAMPASLPSRNSYSRTHSHSISGSLNPAHRVTRRKSTTLNAATSAAAITAAINIEANGEIQGARNRRSVSSRNVLGSLNAGSYPSPPSSLPQNGTAQYSAKNGSVLVDGPPLGDKDKTGLKIRRSSEGAALIKKKSGHGDLKCDTCGKGYKHSSCLTKHLWEHTPEWQYTSKLLISKHQQVQLLEAASVLVAMNSDGPQAESGKMSDSENSSASPAASGFDSREDDISSAETTPPPQHEHAFGHRKQYSNASSVISHSYQSNYSEGGRSSSRHGRQWSTSSSRPVTAGTSIAQSYPDEDQADLAAAVGLLSCSYGTPKTGPVTLPPDVPPVPPLPARYQGLSGASYQPSSLSKVVPQRYQEDIEMDEDSYSDDEGHEAGKADEGEDGVFGQMEE
ncbi:hypothetical protein MBLNU459_g1684t1 [Dothideomycetes sp. NU459]